MGEDCEEESVKLCFIILGLIFEGVGVYYLSIKLLILHIFQVRSYIMWENFNLRLKILCWLIGVTNQDKLERKLLVLSSPNLRKFNDPSYWPSHGFLSISIGLILQIVAQFMNS